MDSRPILEIENLYKGFSGNQVLRGVSLSIGRGEAIAILGPSGVGKTTLLKCINLLTPFEEGAIRLEGHEVARAEEGEIHTSIPPRQLRQQIGMVFQEWNLWPNKTVVENVSEGPRMVRGLSKSNASTVAESLCTRVGLQSKLNSYPSELSGGQKQRAAIARAMAMEPAVLMLDEITSALDPPLVLEVLETITVLKDQSRALLIVTHQVEFAKRIADRVVFLSAGRVTEEGPARDTLEAPRTAEMRNFLAAVTRAR